VACKLKIVKVIEVTLKNGLRLLAMSRARDAGGTGTKA
jgi:hypothetical protein